MVMLTLTQRMGMEPFFMFLRFVTIASIIFEKANADVDAQCKAVFTLDVCFCVSVNVTVKFNIVSMETQTQTYRMGLNPFSASMLI